MIKFRVDKAVQYAKFAIEEQVNGLEDDEKKLFYDLLMCYCEEMGGL
jgi:DNA replication initiation complex subunit (GINS family)